MTPEQKERLERLGFVGAPIERMGKILTVLPYNVQTFEQLQAAGLKVPSPIRHQYAWPGRFKPMAHQATTSAFLTLYKRGFILNEMGCVSGDTEYLTPTGWRRIDEYAGGPVAQYWPETGRMDFVENPQYVKLPCAEMLHIKTKYGIDQMLSPEHRVLLADRRNSQRQEVIQARALYDRYEQWMGGGRNLGKNKLGILSAGIPATFIPPTRCGISLTEAQLRVQIAVIADGHFPNKNRVCKMRLLKERKKERMRMLLIQAQIDFDERPCLPEGFSLFTFEAPRRDKIYSDDYWDATQEQLATVCDEVVRWDGSVRDYKLTESFFSSVRASADFVQYAFAACGRVARLFEHAPREGHPLPEFSINARADGKPLTFAGFTSDGEKIQNLHWVPSPDGFKYCFMVPSTFLVLRRNGCIFCTGNTGKSLSALWAADFLISEGLVHKVLILSTLSTLTPVWSREIFTHLPHRKFCVLHGKGKALVKQPHDFYIMNHDGLRDTKLLHQIASDESFDLVILDESAVFRNSRTARYRSLAGLLKPSGRRAWLMTGTPTPNAPTDAWAQAKLVNPLAVPRFFSDFQGMVMDKVGMYAWRPKRDATRIVHRCMQPAIRFTAEQCLDLPPITYITHHADMTPEQSQAYGAMRKTLSVEIREHKITAANEAVKGNKLLQIACGCLYGEETAEILKAENKMSVLREVIEAAGGKVIIFAPFKKVVDYLHGELSKTWSAEKVYGDTSKNARDRILQSFQFGETQLLIAHPATMSHGLTLTAAATMVWYAPMWSNDVYEQAVARIYRKGQEKHTTIVHLESSAIEQEMYARLKERRSMQGVLLKMFEEVA